MFHRVELLDLERFGFHIGDRSLAVYNFIVLYEENEIITVERLQSERN